jgi:nucleotide-binding universal stress UspA family protein
VPIHLVIANQTLTSEELRLEIVRRIEAGPVRFYVVVPATPIPHPLMWEERESLQAARQRLELIVAWMRDRGAEADGEIGDRDPVAAALDALRRQAADEIILSTLPAGRSRWIHQDVPTRLRRTVALPVTVITPTRDAPEIAPGLASPSPQPQPPG